MRTLRAAAHTEYRMLGKLHDIPVCLPAEHVKQIDCASEIAQQLRKSMRHSAGCTRVGLKLEQDDFGGHAAVQRVSAEVAARKPLHKPLFGDI